MFAMKRLLVLLLFVLAGCAHRVPVENPVATIAELRSTPERYDGKPVRVRGIWFQDFETSTLVIRSLDEKDWIYVETKDEAALADPKYVAFEAARLASAKAQLAKFAAGSRDANWTFVATVELEGIFETARPRYAPFGGFGHMGIAPFQIRLQRVLNYKIE